MDVTEFYHNRQQGRGDPPRRYRGTFPVRWKSQRMQR